MLEVIDERGHPDTMPESCPVEKLYIYRTVSGRRFDTPGFVWIIAEDDAPGFVWIIAEDASSTPYSNGCNTRYGGVEAREPSILLFF
ncbi:protein TRANSPORT INHIBITOR RESPONSE 1-like isoform X1 [Capsicum annuum]|uniref:protein TRANSPORT INHIBITOR RESPONSE 1-like isoform X1 n=1 Tax=Capsicum annuum TaxID=4072 RepID=UPI001FB0ADB3|nr:protein TRANSPORT INHIBITOR RESPONSE 1-like isoform X1 [Capsicum annuum]